MVEIEAGPLEGSIDDLSDFLSRKLGVQTTKEGGRLILSKEEKSGQISSRTVRTYVRRFLHARGLKNQFRLLSEKGKLRFAKLEVEEESAESSS